MSTTDTAGFLKFDQVFPVADLTRKFPEATDRVQVATIQAMIRRIFEDPDATRPTPGTYDLIIVDEAQLPFVEHCIRALKLGGRAAVVVPDNVLFDDGRGKLLRQRLMSWCDLHTILRLPTGIFYAQGVKTNVLFFTRSSEEAPAEDATKVVWIYDMRSGAPAYGKTNPLKDSDFDRFVSAFGNDPRGLAERTDEGETGRFRRFTRDEIAARNDSLDITWLRNDNSEAEEALADSEDNPMQRAHAAPRCGAKSKRTGKPCRAPTVRGWAVCRMHGAGGGAPKGNKNGGYRHGGRTREMINATLYVNALVKLVR